jgi:hypothetical protein
MLHTSLWLHMPMETSCMGAKHTKQGGPGPWALGPGPPRGEWARPPLGPVSGALPGCWRAALGVGCPPSPSFSSPSSSCCFCWAFDCNELLGGRTRRLVGGGGPDGPAGPSWRRCARCCCSSSGLCCSGGGPCCDRCPTDGDSMLCCCCCCCCCCLRGGCGARGRGGGLCVLVAGMGRAPSSSSPAPVPIR